MPSLSVTTSPKDIYLLAGALEDIVCQDVNFTPGTIDNTFTAELGSMSSSVRSNVRQCLAQRGVTSYEFDDEK
jgi:hypothetical protein